MSSLEGLDARRAGWAWLELAGTQSYIAQMDSHLDLGAHRRIPCTPYQPPSPEPIGRPRMTLSHPAAWLTCSKSALRPGLDPGLGAHARSEQDTAR